MGNVGGKAALERLMPLVTDATRPLAVRSAAATALGKSKAGEEYLLALAKDKKLSADITFTVANVLLASALPEVRSRSRQVFAVAGRWQTPSRCRRSASW